MWNLPSDFVHLYTPGFYGQYARILCISMRMLHIARAAHNFQDGVVGAGLSGWAWGPAAEPEVEAYPEHDGPRAQTPPRAQSRRHQGAHYNLRRRQRRHHRRVTRAQYR